MPVFTYKAVDGRGQSVSGSLTADTPAVARTRLRDEGFRLTEFEQVRFRGEGSVSAGLWRRGRADEAAEFARQMALLLRTDVVLVAALDVMIRQHRGRFLVVLRDIRERVAGGASLAQALHRHPGWFDGVFRGAVRVGQSSGRLDQALDDLGVYLRERQALRGKFLNALAYPIILAVLGCAVVLFLMSHVVPQLLGILETSGGALPIATQGLKTASDAIVGHWFALSVAIGVTLFGLRTVERTERGRYRIQLVALKVPVLGPLVAKNVIAQFAQMMSLLLRSGVSFLDALHTFRGECTNAVLARELEQTEKAVKRGSDIAPTLASSRIFPPLVAHVVNVGQQSGELTTMLTQLSDGYASEVRLAVARFTAVLEPGLMVVMSVVIGFIVFATMMPILEVTRTLQQ